MAILGLQNLGTAEVLVCAIVALYFCAGPIEDGWNALRRRLGG